MAKAFLPHEELEQIPQMLSSLLPASPNDQLAVIFHAGFSSSRFSQVEQKSHWLGHSLSCPCGNLWKICVALRSWCRRKRWWREREWRGWGKQQLLACGLGKIWDSGEIGQYTPATIWRNVLDLFPTLAPRVPWYGVKYPACKSDDVDRGSQARTPANWRYNLLEPEGEWFLDMRITNLVACGWLIPRSMWPLWGHSHLRFVAQARVKLNALGKDANLRCFPSFFLAAHLHHLGASCWKRVLIAQIKLPGLIPKNTLRCVKMVVLFTSKV